MDYRLVLERRTGWQWPLGLGDRLVLWETNEIRVQVEIPALVNLLLAKALEADFVTLLLVDRKTRQRAGDSPSLRRRTSLTSSRSGTPPPSP